MASLATVSKTKYSLTLNVDGLNSTSTYTEIYITCNGQTSGNLAKGGSGWTYSNTATFSGLACGTSYSASYSLKTSAGSTGSGSGSSTTDPCQPPSSLTGLSMYATGQSSLSSSWNSASGATSYDYVLRTSGGSTVTNGNTTSTSRSFSGLSSGTSYTLTVTPRNNDGYGGSSSVSATTDAAPPPAPPAPTISSVSPGITYPDQELFVDWNTISGATNYRIENVTTGYYDETTSSEFNWTGLQPSTTYGFRVQAFNGTWGSFSSIVYGTTAAAVDRTPPTVTITGSSGNGQMSFSFSGSDASGINFYRVYISGANNSTFTEKAIVSPPSNSYAFSSDGTGAAFVNGAQYKMRVIAYDNNNNTSSPADVTVTYQKIRPSNWTWTTLKNNQSTTLNSTSGKAPVVSSSEWNNFCARINDFRTYKNLSIISFAQPSSGADFQTMFYNQAVNAINPMATVTTSSRPYTALLNLSSALNSIT